ncbi:MAG TPA: hydrogenase formation protein HypD [Clostridiales bacterium]|nr:hydrogenase formation protein HypD [Clostridiales bacterium]HPP34861.1 hydrogenase formation protein HypD [Clostridiales bacterium]
MRKRYRIEDIKNRISEIAAGLGQITVMEVCGTHTANIHKYGIQDLLPGNVRLVSGPGCPVCVTDQKDIAAALSLAERDDVIFACFGDMMRVTCGDRSLYSLYESGKDVRVVTSALDALQIARDNPDRQTVYFGIGFETTAPQTAALIEAADESGIRNLSVLSVHKTMPQAIRQLLGNGSGINALMCPGHVATITGAEAFGFIPDELGLPAVIAGFEAYDIMAALLRILYMLQNCEIKCVNMYPRAVTGQGNKEALSLIYKVFEPCDAVWRGLGEIKGSGLGIRDRYKEFDAARRFDISADETMKAEGIKEAEGCICASILCGKNIPADCVNFGRRCTPDRPLGPCMVSAEGSCAAAIRYGDTPQRGVFLSG